jgi:hypothetical protein
VIPSEIEVDCKASFLIPMADLVVVTEEAITLFSPIDESISN